MGFWTRILIVLGILVGIPYYWLLVDARTAAVPARTIDISRLRQAAQELPGAKPVAIEFAPVAVRRIAGAAMVAGGGLKPDLVGVIAFRLITPGGDTVIESGMTHAQADAMKFVEWNARAQARVDRWMQGARMIVFTHEHPDHVGGYLGSAHFPQIAGKAVIIPTMLPGMRQVAPQAAGHLPQPLIYGDFAAVAPGIVLLRTPGHTPGSQMIYVQLQDGREYLFTGDTAGMQRNVTWQRPRSHLLSDWIVPEDRAATIAWIKGLGDLAHREPRLTLVYSHDLAWMQNAKRGPGFLTDFPYKTRVEDREPDDVETPATSPTRGSGVLK